MEAAIDSQPKPLPKLTRKQAAFVRQLIENPKMSGTQAALATYNVNNDVTAASVASENLRKPLILAHLEQASERAELNMLEFMAQRKDPRLAFDASKDVLDRVHGKATQRVESVSTGVSITIDLTGMSLDNSGAESVDPE